MPSIFEQVRERVSLNDAISYLGLQVKQESPGQFRTACPACKGSGKRDLSINAERGFRCFRSSKSGNDATALVAHVRGVSQGDAAKMLSDHFIGEQQTTAARADVKSVPSRSPSPRQAEDLKPLDYLDVSHEAIELLGLTEPVCEALGIGYAPKGTMVGRVVVPLRLPDGTLVGYFGVATKADMPLLSFPKNLEERCRVDEAPAEDERPPADELRKLWRVVK